MRSIWRRFKPSATTTHILTTELYKRAQAIIDQQQFSKRQMWQKHDYSSFNPIIQKLLDVGQLQNSPEYLIASLVFQAPRAVRSQRKMDKHSYDFHNKKSRVDELIEFNDTYVSAVLVLPASEYSQFNVYCKALIDSFCHRVGSPSFSDTQWEAITHGLGREIAVFRTAQKLGYKATMTSRKSDAMGVDMVITDSTSGNSINIDVKTRSSFHFRLLDLVREGRVSELVREEAELFGHLSVTNGHDVDKVVTTLLRIDEETYGRVVDFLLERPEALHRVLGEIVR